MGSEIFWILLISGMPLRNSWAAWLNWADGTQALFQSHKAWGKAIPLWSVQRMLQRIGWGDTQFSSAAKLLISGVPWRLPNQGMLLRVSWVAEINWANGWALPQTYFLRNTAWGRLSLSAQFCWTRNQLTSRKKRETNGKQIGNK